MKLHRPITQPADSRAGFLVPAILVALLVIMAGVALVLDQLWLENASVEMQAAVDASVLAAGRQLATDDLLKPNFNAQNQIDKARNRANDIASGNRVAGQPVNLEESGSIRIGRRIDNPSSGRVNFVETTNRPNSVRVIAHRSRRNGNPIALFFRQLTGQSSGDVSCRAEATIENRIVGFRPLEHLPIPVLPIAILETDSISQRTDTWQVAIEQRLGADQFRLDEKTGQVVRGADGIPEITLRFEGDEKTDEKRNVLLIAPQSRWQRVRWRRAIKSGWTRDDFAKRNAEISLPRSEEQVLRFFTTRLTNHRFAELFDTVLGQCRIVFLTRNCSESDDSHFDSVNCHRVVAGRVMDVRIGNNGSFELVFQPGVLTTPTAILSDDVKSSSEKSFARNRYIYKLRLTH